MILIGIYFIISVQVGITKCTTYGTLVDCPYAIPNSICVNETCECDTGYKYGPSQTSCLENELTDPCGINADCSTTMNYTECSGGQCQCLGGFERIGNQTCDPVMIGVRPCSNNNDCNNTIAFSDCQSGLCACQQGYTATNGNQSCSCMYYYNGECIPVQLGVTTCSGASDCSAWVANATCGTGGVCECSAGFISINSDTECRMRVIGDNCTSNVDCSAAMNNTECATGGTCSCIGGYRTDPLSNGCDIGEYSKIYQLVFIYFF